MSDAIFLLRGPGQLVEMRAARYDTEALLQALIADHPDLLAGEQISPGAPRRWLLVGQEMGVAAETGGTDRWWVDHLLLDQDAVPTVVEVKRSSDTRIRREVVGQMLDYAANAVAYWPVEALVARFEATCRERGAEPGPVLDAVLGVGSDHERFWQQAKTNLQAGRLRLVFVADEIPPELRRVVEFLNGQMDPAEILAVEIKQYVGGGLTTLVPRVLGQTADAVQRKSVGGGPPGEPWTWERFAAELARRDPALVEPARALLDWTTRSGLRVSWGRGKSDGSFFPTLDHGGDWYCPIAVWSYGRVEVQFQTLQTKPPFRDEQVRAEFARRLNDIPGIDIPSDALRRRPSFPLSALSERRSLEALLAVLDWFMELVKAGDQGPDERVT